MSEDHPALVSDLPEPTTAEAGERVRIGPSGYMLWGDLLMHPLFAGGCATLIFMYSPWIRRSLWGLSDYRIYRHSMMDAFEWLSVHPWLPFAVCGLALAHVYIRYATSFYEYDNHYLHVRIGMLNWRGPAGPFKTFNDPIAFSTITDANAPRGLLSHLTGAGTLEILTTEGPRDQPRVLNVRWVPNIRETQQVILARAGVKRARMLTSA